MPLEYYEAFGYTPEAPLAEAAFKKKQCPFVGTPCSKQFKGGIKSGSCSLMNPSDGIPIPVCPKRLYGDNYRILRDVVQQAWGAVVPLVMTHEEPPTSGDFVMAFGQGHGHEIRIPNKAYKGATKFSIDWILALVSDEGELKGFVAVEVQTIDTTGNYHRSFLALAERFDPAISKKMEVPENKNANFNFRNVTKRILPQLISKGHILRREKLCTRGLFFVCPLPVYKNISESIGKLEDYPVQNGSITFMGYSLDTESSIEPKPLKLEHVSTSTTEQLTVAFASAVNLPPQGVYEEAIRKALIERLEGI